MYTKTVKCFETFQIHSKTKLKKTYGHGFVWTGTCKFWCEEGNFRKRDAIHGNAWDGNLGDQKQNELNIIEVNCLKCMCDQVVQSIQLGVSSIAVVRVKMNYIVE